MYANFICLEILQAVIDFRRKMYSSLWSHFELDKEKISKINIAAI